MTIRLDFRYQRGKVRVLEDRKGGPLKTGPPQDRDIWIGSAECPGGNLRAATFARYIENLHALDDVAGEVAGTVRSFYRPDTSIATSARRSSDRIGQKDATLGVGSDGAVGLRGGVALRCLFRGTPQGLQLPADYSAVLACNENAAPWGSIAFTTQSPPGTSIGPLRILPPFALIRSVAALMSGTRK